MDEDTLIEHYRITELNIGVYFTTPAFMVLPDGRVAVHHHAEWPVMEIVYNTQSLRYWVSLQ